MPKLWLTYAWKDNDDQDVDHVINELTGEGIEVIYDRKHLLVGRRLWEQIDKGINDPTVDGWAIFTTENSLASEPCQEEISYALDRTLRTKGANYPLVGIFPQPIDRELVPSALATRLFVNLADPTWKTQIADSLKGVRSAPDLSKVKPYLFRWHEDPSGFILEVRPRSGRWVNPVVLVPKSQGELLKGFMVNPAGHPNMSGMVSGGEIDDRAMAGYGVNGLVDAANSLYVRFTHKPMMVLFGADGTSLNIEHVATPISRPM